MKKILGLIELSPVYCCIVWTVTTYAVYAILLKFSSNVKRESEARCWFSHNRVCVFFAKQRCFAYSMDSFDSKSVCNPNVLLLRRTNYDWILLASCIPLVDELFRRTASRTGSLASCRQLLLLSLSLLCWRCGCSAALLLALCNPYDGWIFHSASLHL